MSYQAIIAPLVNVREHPNADRLKLANCSSFQIIVGLENHEGELGIFFPCDGKLSRKYLLENSLYQKHPDTNEKMGGYFGKKGRVKAQKFRGEMSEGFWAPLDTLEWTGVDVGSLKQGDLIDELNGHLICEKYFTPATLRAIGQSKKQKRIVYETFKEHWDTQQLRNHIKFIPEDVSIITISEKVHGTSGRTGHIYAKNKLNKFQRWWNRWCPLKFKEGEYVYVSGTRKVVLDPDFTEDTGYYSGKKFRYLVHEMFRKLEIPLGYCFYYEIVGFSEDGGHIMHPHKIEDKDLKKVYGDQMVYKYGCDPDDPEKCFRVLVYRITVVNQDGVSVDLPIPQIKRICSKYGLETVPYLQGPMSFDGPESLLLQCRTLCDGPDVLDPSHIREGVVVRVEHETGVADYKWKGSVFCFLENIAKNDDFFIDMEEIS